MTNYWKLEKDITIVKGKTWQAKFRWLSASCKGKTKVPVDLTAYEAANFVIREHVEDSAVLLTLTVGAGITLGGADGTITIDMTATQASSLTVGDNVYELELIDGATVIGFATGKAVVYEEVARA